MRISSNSLRFEMSAVITMILRFAFFSLLLLLHFSSLLFTLPNHCNVFKFYSFCIGKWWRCARVLRFLRTCFRVLCVILMGQLTSHAQTSSCVWACVCVCVARKTSIVKPKKQIQFHRNAYTILIHLTKID